MVESPWDSLSQIVLYIFSLPLPAMVQVWSCWKHRGRFWEWSFLTGKTGWGISWGSGGLVLLFSKWLFEKLLFISSQVSLWNFSLHGCNGKRGYECISKCIDLVPGSRINAQKLCLYWTPCSTSVTTLLLIFFMPLQFYISQVML